MMSETVKEEPTDEAALLRRAQAGDSDAFAALCERHRRRIWRVAASVARTRADADDLAQEAILRALRSLPAFRGESSFAAWLCRIALNAAHDFQKSAWRRRVLLRTDSAPMSMRQEPSTPCSGDCGGFCGGAPHEEAARRELQRRVRAAVASLGPKERVPIYLIYFEEFTLADVARLERVPESTVRSRVKAGLRRMGPTLHDLGYPEGEGTEDCGGNTVPAGMSAETVTRIGKRVGSGEWKGCRI